MLPQGLVFSNESEDYLASSSVVSPLSVLPTHISHKAPFRNHQKLLIIKTFAGAFFSIPLPLLCQRVSGSSRFSSQMRVTLPYFSEEEVFPWTSQVQGTGLQNSFSLSPDPNLCLLWLFLAGYYMGSLSFFQQHWAPFLQWPRFCYSHKFRDSDLPYLRSSKTLDNWQL